MGIGERKRYCWQEREGGVGVKDCSIFYLPRPDPLPSLSSKLWNRI